MLFKPAVRIAVLTGIGCIVVIALSIAIAGCGRKSEERELPVQIVRDQSAQAPAPIDTGLPAAAEQPEEAAVPEPPREITYEEAEAAYLERRYDEAEELFILYTRCNEGNPWGHYMLGLSAWKTGDLKTAHAAFEQAVGLDPNHMKSYLNLSRVLIDMNRAEEALTKIDMALAIDPESNDGHRLQGRAFHELGRNEEAIAAYRRAIQIDGEDAWSMNNLSLILIERNECEAALPALARAVELRDDVAIFQNNLGMALERTGRIRAAEDAYRIATVLDGSYEHAAMNLARVAEVLEDPAVEPVDLAAVARRFQEEIVSWNEMLAIGGRDEVREPLPMSSAMSPADSTGDGITP